MLNAPRLLSFFISVSVIVLVIEFLLAVRMMKTKNEYREYIIIPIGIGQISTLLYINFLCTKSIGTALLFDSLYFVGTDWLAFTMLIFGINYTGIHKKYVRVYEVIGILLCTADTISLVLNNSYHHMFQLLFTTGLENQWTIGYLGNLFYWPHYIHLAMCYLFVGLTFVYFTIALVKVPSFYKKKYSGIYIVYLIVILANFVSYNLSLPIDFSVILYGLLSGFICYFSTFSYPKTLTSNALEKVHEIISDAIVYFDIDGNCLFANNSAKKLFAVDDVFRKTVAEDYRNKLEAPMLQAFTDEELNEVQDEIFYSKDSFIIDNVLRKFDVEYQQIFTYERTGKKKNGSILRLVDNTKDNEHLEKEKKLRRRDHLTGVYNSFGFFEKVDQVIRENGIGEGDDKRIMICSNIKDFRLINDLFDEATGDKVLIKQATLFRMWSEQSTIYGRIGSDKFAAFIKKSLFTEERFESFISEMQEITEDSYFHMHVYVGIYEPTSIKESAHSMVTKALLAIENISHDYNKTYAYYDKNVIEKNRQENEIADKFEKALSSGEFEMYLQPLFDKNKKILGAESLSRWNDGDRGMIYPSEYIPVLEKFGLINKLDKHIWTEAFHKLAEWNQKGIQDIFISVNVSMHDFYNFDIFQCFKELSVHYGVNPKNVLVELEENVLTVDFTRAKEVLNNLRNYGFSVAIDDFGKNYSSLNMIKDFEADILKIDVGFLNEELEDERNIIILETMIDIARDLEMKVMVEGIEKSQLFNLLKKKKCDCFQGKFVSLPVSVKEFESKYLIEIEEKN